MFDFHLQACKAPSSKREAGSIEQGVIALMEKGRERREAKQGEARGHRSIGLFVLGRRSMLAAVYCAKHLWSGHFL